MDLEELSRIIKENGVVGAGGAGFPAYAKLDGRTNTIVLNCAECEPTLRLHRQLLKKFAKEILTMLTILADTVGAERVIIAMKEEYKTTRETLLAYLPEFPKVQIHLLEAVYPAGDEFVLIYETTKRVVAPGALPISVGVTVYNVETVFNMYRAVTAGKPVTDKAVSIQGEVATPMTVKVPLGMTIEEVTALAGGATIKDPAYLLGGPMMGRLGSGMDRITKTTNAILVLPKDHLVVQRKQQNTSIDLKRAASACCQCQTCTDLCPRNLLGHPIEPHRFMRSAANEDFRDINIYLDTMFCSSCGLCEMYACPQGLSPRTLLTAYKNGLRQAGVKPPKRETDPIRTGTTGEAIREYRKVPSARLVARLDLSRYNKSAPLTAVDVTVRRVRLLLSQHIGAPARPVVAVGDMVNRGELIAAAAEGLSVPIHASVCGMVTEVTERYIEIEARLQQPQPGGGELEAKGREESVERMELSHE